LDHKFIKMLRDGTIDKAQVPELKEYLTIKNLPCKGNKNFLVEILKEHLEALGYA
jgi:thiaminase